MLKITTATKSVPGGITVAPKKTDAVVAPAPVTAAVADQRLPTVEATPKVSLSQVQPYQFSISDEKGSKALTRFRENLRNNYPTCGHLRNGLMVRDAPFLQLYCYDPATDKGYCRLSSPKHTGPLFASLKSLYATYNCSSQGHITDVFLYCSDDATDEDNGIELTKFLSECEILHPNAFPVDYVNLFETEVANNPLLAAYDAAIESKRSRKAAIAATQVKPPTSGAPGGGTIEGGEGKKRVSIDDGGEEEAVDDESAASSVAAADKKKPGRPKGSKSGPSAFKKHKKKPVTVSQTSDEAASAVSFVNAASTVGGGGGGVATKGIFPFSINELSLDVNDMDNSVAVFTYKSEPMRFGDLPPESIERSAMSWTIYKHISEVNPGDSAEGNLKKGLFDMHHQPASPPIVEDPIIVEERVIPVVKAVALEAKTTPVAKAVSVAKATPVAKAVATVAKAVAPVAKTPKAPTKAVTSDSDDDSDEEMMQQIQSQMAAARKK